MLSRREQVTRMRGLAAGALDAYGVVDPQVTFVTHGENTTFRIDAAGGHTSAPPERYLLRVHRPARHGRDVDSSAAITSELQWLEAVRRTSDLLVPEPARTHDGALVVRVASDAVPEGRVCSLLRWMDGRIHAGAPRPVHLRRLGAAMARLHNQADEWDPPSGFVRIRWDWETFFGNTMVYGGIEAADVWDLLPRDVRTRFDRVAADARMVMDELGEGPGVFGLIHADLHLENALFLDGDVRLIDFDDSGHGHRLYEIAVGLWELRHSDGYETFREALLAGYREHRPFDADQLRHLDAYIAVREVAFGLWFVGTAQVNPAFREDLDQVLRNITVSLDALRPA